MSSFQINNVNTGSHRTSGKARPLKSQGAKIDTTDSFKPSLKSVSSPVDLKKAAKLFAKKAEELSNIKWEFDTGSNSAFTTEPVFMEDGSIIVKSFDQKLYSLNPKDGSKNWELKMGNFSYNPPTVGPDSMLFSDCKDEKTMCAVDGKTGAKLWEKDIKYKLRHSPAIGPDGNVYVINGHQGDILALDPKTGKNKAKFEVGENFASIRKITDKGVAVIVRDDTSHVAGYDIKTGEKKWEHQVNPEGKSMKTTYSQDDCIYSSNKKGLIAGMNAKSGEIKWKFDTTSYTRKTKSDCYYLDKEPGVSNEPVVGKDGKVYIYDDRGILFGMDPDIGKPAWAYESDEAITTTPLITEKGEVFLGSTNSQVIKLDAKNGKELWKSRIVVNPKGKPVISDDNVLFVDTGNGHILRLSGETGKVLLGYNTPNGDIMMTVLPGKGNKTIIGDDDGKITCIGEKKFYEETEVTENADSSTKADENLKIKKEKEFVDIGGVKLRIKKKE